MITRREQIGSAGGFANAAMQAALTGTVKDLVRAYCVADEHNREELLRVFPGLDVVARYVHDVWPAHLPSGLTTLWPTLGLAIEKPDQPVPIARPRWQDRLPHEEGKLAKTEDLMQSRVETEVIFDGP